MALGGNSVDVWRGRRGWRGSPHTRRLLLCGFSRSIPRRLRWHRSIRACRQLLTVVPRGHPEPGSGGAPLLADRNHSAASSARSHRRSPGVADAGRSRHASGRNIDPGTRPAARPRWSVEDRAGLGALCTPDSRRGPLRGLVEVLFPLLLLSPESLHLEHEYGQGLGGRLVAVLADPQLKRLILALE